MSTYEYIGVHKDVVGVETLFCYGSECQIREHFLFFLCQGVNPAGHPDSYEGVNELLAGRPVLLQKQFEHTFALLLNLSLSLIIRCIKSVITSAKLRKNVNCCAMVPPFYIFRQRFTYNVADIHRFLLILWRKLRLCGARELVITIIGE